MKKTLLWIIMAVVCSALISVFMLSGCKEEADMTTEETAEDASEETSEEAGSDEASGTLNLLLWEGYSEDEWKIPFEEENNCVVNTTYIGSDDELFAKLKAGGGKVYDMVATNRANLASLSSADLIVPIDEAKVPAYEKVFEAFKQDAFLVDGVLYSIPFVWGTLPMEVDLDVVEEPFDTWGVLWDEKYAGKISMIEDASASIAVTAIYLGLDDPYNLSDEEFEMVKEKLMEQKPLIRTYTTGYGEVSNAFAAKEVVAALTQGEYLHKLLTDQGLNTMQVIPKEGALIWCDTWAIVNGAANLDLAYKWIDKCLEIDTQQVVVEKLNYGGVSNELPGVLSEDTKALFNMFDEDSVMEYFNNLIMMDNPESWDKRISLWNEIKAGVE